MSDTSAASDQAEQPQVYLITPPEFELSLFPDQLARILDSHEISCLRMALATTDENRLCKTGDILREVCHARDVAIVIDSHVVLAERLGLDGVHLNDSGRSLTKGLRGLRDDIGADAIIGAHCGTSRHHGLSAGEAGADYISFGPVGEVLTGDGSRVDISLFQWWSEVIEIPVVAEGALDEELIRTLSPFTDFFGIGEEIWRHDDASSALTGLVAAMK